MTTAAIPIRGALDTGTRLKPSRRWTVPVALGAFGFLASFAGSWIPSFWGDEAASVLSAERSLPSLFRMLGHVDAVHGAYYVFLHFWIELFGASELSVRLPSALAAGVLVAGTFVLVQLFTLRRVGVVAAAVCAVLPRINYLGAETRSYAFSTAIAVWLTVALVVLIRKHSTSRLAWLGYGIGMAVGLYVFLYLGLLVAVHAAYVFSSRSRLFAARRWLQAMGVAVVLALPILAWGYRERGQVKFLSDRHYNTPNEILVSQWFGNNLPLAIIGWGLVLVALAVALRTWRRTGRRSTLVELALLWTVLPTALLLAMNLVTPTYNLRYLSFSTPGLAILIAVGAWSLPRHWARIAAIVAVIGVTVPTDIAQRMPYAKDLGSDWAQASAIIGSEALPGDAVVFDRTTRPSERPRLAMHLYPSDYKGLVDVALKSSYLDRDHLWDTTWPLDEIPTRFDGVGRVWLVELSGSKDNLDGTDAESLRDLGYVQASMQTVNRTVIYSFTKGG